MRNTAVFLCNLTINAAQPWIDAGHFVVLVDPQHPEGIRTEGTITRVGHSITDAVAMAYLGALVRANCISFVAGFPPCTDVSLSGTRWWEAKRKADPYFQAKAAIVAEQCRMIGELSGAPWFFENPMSVFSRIFGKPQYKFHPYHYTGYEPAANYTKETWLWTGGGFVMPESFRDNSLGPPDDRIHKCPPGEDRANFRSATPRGFSKAVFRANGFYL